MVIDTSAIMAILKAEPEAQRLADAIDEADTRLMSAASLVEAGIVAESRREGGKKLDEFLLRARIEIVPFDADQAAIAREAFRRFGKGRHRAGLNLGDCFAYALAQHAGDPLLFKGEDFAATDVTIVRSSDDADD